MIYFRQNKVEEIFIIANLHLRSERNPTPLSLKTTSSLWIFGVKKTPFFRIERSAKAPQDVGAQLWICLLNLWKLWRNLLSGVLFLDGFPVVAANGSFVPHGYPLAVEQAFEKAGARLSGFRGLPMCVEWTVIRWSKETHDNSWVSHETCVKNSDFTRVKQDMICKSIICKSTTTAQHSRKIGKCHHWFRRIGHELGMAHIMEAAGLHMSVTEKHLVSHVVFLWGVANYLLTYM